jgi:hypothetical protein
MAEPLLESLGQKISHIALSETIPVNYSSTRGAQFISSTVTGNTFSKPFALYKLYSLLNLLLIVWQNYPASPQTLSSWFSDIKYWLHHKTTCKDLLENSGNWLLENNAFKEWKSSPASSVLWLHGIPGSGKTKLVAQVINNLEPFLPAGSFAYFYCLRSAAEDERSRPEEVIRSILRQLAFAGNGARVLKEPAAKKYEAKEKEAKKHCSDEIDRLTLQECIRLLVELLKDTSTAIVIDAIDELKKDDRWILYEALDTIQEELEIGVVRILISSRDDGDIKMKLSCYPNVYIKATDNKDDVQQFVIQEVDKAIKNCRLLRGSVSIDLKADIINTLIEGAQGM